MADASPGQAKTNDFAYTRRRQGVTRGGQGGPGGGDIVDEPGSLGRVPSTRAAGESLVHVALTGPGVESGLGGGVPGPHQPTRNQRVARASGNLPSDERGRVEAPAAEAAAVKGHGNDPVPRADPRVLTQGSGKKARDL